MATVCNHTCSHTHLSVWKSVDIHKILSAHPLIDCYYTKHGCLVIHQFLYGTTPTLVLKTCDTFYKHMCTSVPPIIRSVIIITIHQLCFFCISVSDWHQDEKSSRYRYMNLFRNTCSCAPNNVYKCNELHFPVL